MPTSRPRHPVTETDDIAAVLNQAARKWPGTPRAKLIRLVLTDWADGRRSTDDRSVARRRLVGSLPGSSGLYHRSRDWPK